MDEGQVRKLRVVPGEAGMDESEARKLRIAKRIALVVGIVVGLIFCGTAFLGFIYFTTDQPAKEYLLGNDPPAEQ